MGAIDIDRPSDAQIELLLLDFERVYDVETGLLMFDRSEDTTFAASDPTTIDELISRYATGGVLNPAEAGLLTSEPLNSIYAMIAGYRSVDVTNKLWERSSTLLGNGDAFRHCLWMWLLTDDAGQPFAKRWGDAHETVDSGLSKEMDIYNNDRGMFLNVTGKPIESVIDAVFGGGLRRVVGGRLVPTNSDGIKPL